MGDYGEWIIFNLLVCTAFFVDSWWFKDKRYSFRSSLVWSGAWTALAALVAIWFFYEDGSLWLGHQRGVEFVAAYVAERALSIDNLFVFVIIFEFFRVPVLQQPMALTYGIVGALIARAVFIIMGLTLLHLFSWILMIMGAFLIYAGWKIAFTQIDNLDPSHNFLFKLTKRFFRLSDQFVGNRLMVKNRAGQRVLTPLCLLVVVLASTDMVFALDSIPTVFGITTDSFIVWSSNMMAVVGMRPLYFLIVAMKDKFRYLKYGLSCILVFIGGKMMLGHGVTVGGVSYAYAIDTGWSLMVIVMMIVISMVFSVIMDYMRTTKT